MTANILFQQLTPTLMRIDPNPKTIELYRQIQDSLTDFVLKDSFHQIKKNAKGQGLAVELMFFNEYLIYDIVFSQTNIDYITVLTKNVSMAYIESSFGQIINPQGQVSAIDLVKLTIKYDGVNSLEYSTEVKRFSELNKLKNSLLNLLIR